MNAEVFACLFESLLGEIEAVFVRALCVGVCKFFNHIYEGMAFAVFENDASIMINGNPFVGIVFFFVVTGAGVPNAVPFKFF